MTHLGNAMEEDNSAAAEGGKCRWGRGWSGGDCKTD